MVDINDKKGELLFDETRTLGYYEDDGDYYGYFSDSTVDIPVLEQGTVIHCYIYYDNALMKEGDVILGTKSDSIFYEYKNVSFGLSFTEYNDRVVGIYPNDNRFFSSLESMPLKEWRFVAEFLEDSDSTESNPVITYLMTSPSNTNWNVLSSMLGDGDWSELKAYVETTPHNMNRMVLESLLSGGNSNVVGSAVVGTAVAG